MTRMEELGYEVIDREDVRVPGQKGAGANQHRVETEAVLVCEKTNPTEKHRHATSATGSTISAPFSGTTRSGSHDDRFDQSVRWLRPRP
jgi:hypothetical protein